MTANSATQQFSITPQPITNHFATLPRSGLVQQVADGNGAQVP
jgi:hypothetical protein